MLKVAYDYGQLYVYDAAREFSSEAKEYLYALDAAEGSGGSGLTEVAVPPGRHRARLSGFGLDAASAWNYGDPADPADSYRLELWPEGDLSPAAELKRWPGYAALM